MVKNFGGNKAKKQARKYTNNEISYNTRFAKEEGEIYGAITKVYGNGRAEIKCIDGIIRILIIRNKFKGRSRRDNNIEVGTWVLAGERIWEVVKEGAKKTCDLLEVYNSNDIDNLKQSVNLPWNIFNGIGKLHTEENNDIDNIVFNNNDTEMQEEVTMEELSVDSDEIDIDDI